MNRALIWMIGLSGLTHCEKSSDNDDSQSSTDTMSSANDPSTMGGSGGARSADVGATFPPDWCGRLGETDAAKLDTVEAIFVSYLTAHSSDCETAELASLIEDQFDVWYQYLTDYTFLLAGCEPNFGTVAGGITVFGPANTAFVGVVRAPLSQREADLLVGFYTTAFASGLGLSDSERESVRAYLAQTASNEVDSTATGSLSRCSPADADGGLADAGN